MKMKYFTNIFFQLVVLVLHHIEANQYKTEMSVCNGTRVLHFKSDVPMELCCTTDHLDCIRDDSLLTINRIKDGIKSKIETSWAQNGNASTVKLTIFSPKEIDSGKYACYCNGSFIKSRDVFVIDKVNPPRILSITSTIKGNVTVRFDPGEAVEKYHDSYSVIAQVQAEKFVLCKNKTISCKNRRCSCKNVIGMPMNKIRSLVRSMDVTIIVVRQRSVQESEAKKMVNLIQRVKPGQVDGFRVENLNSTSAVLAMCPPSSSFSVIRNMAYHKTPFKINVSVVKTQGLFEERNFNITLDSYSLDSYSKYCPRIILSHLTPFTMFNVSVTTAGGGGESKPIHRNFTTSQAAPLSPPEGIIYWIVQDEPTTYSFDSLHQDSVLPQQKMYSININWKPIPHDLRGGNITYEVNVTYEYKGKRIALKHYTNKTFLILRNISDTPVSVKIRSKNKMGPSKDLSYLNIPKYSLHAGIKQLKSHVEIANNQAEVIIEKPPPNVKISAIYWCIGNQYSKLPSQIICEKYPERISDGNDNQNRIVSLKAKDCEIKTVSESRQAVYGFYKDLNDKGSSPRYQNVTAIHVFAKKDSSCPSSSLNNDKDGVSIKQQTNEYKFMFSIQGSHRLFPFKCYYDSKFDSVKLYFNQSSHGNVINLAWRQGCDFNRPQQFLAKEFHVYTSEDDTCPNVDGNFIKVENGIIHRAKFKVNKASTYVCVSSFKSSNGTIPPSKAKPYKIERPRFSKTDDGSPIGTVTSTVVSVLAVMILMSCCVLLSCKRRKKTKDYFKRFQPDQDREIGRQEEDKITNTYIFSGLEDEDSGKGSSDYTEIKLKKTQVESPFTQVDGTFKISYRPSEDFSKIVTDSGNCSGDTKISIESDDQNRDFSNSDSVSTNTSQNNNWTNDSNISGESGSKSSDVAEDNDDNHRRAQRLLSIEERFQEIMRQQLNKK